MESFTGDREPAILHVWRSQTAYERQKGRPYAGEFTNISFSALPRASQGPVRQFDIRKRHPFPDDTFDAIHSNHVVEHLTVEETGSYLAETQRVLKPGGIFRLAVPDLESKCREYILRLEGFLAEPSDPNRLRYEWAVLDLLDQLVRERPGGQMQKTLDRGEFDPDQVRHLTGDAYRRVLERHFPRARPDDTADAPVTTGGPPKRPWLDWPLAVMRKARVALHRNDPRYTGEAHKWLWDRVSLQLLLAEHGFIDYRTCTYNESAIPGWEQYDLNTSEYGDYPQEPSVYVEGRKPPGSRPANAR